MAKSDFPFHYPVRVRWSETDAQGIVFNARYLDYADIAITEYWRQCGILQNSDTQPFETHAKAVSVDWVAPITPDEMIEVMARTVKIGSSSLTQKIEIHGQNDAATDDLRAEIDMVYVHIDPQTHKPAPVPDWARKVMADLDATASKMPTPAKEGNE